MSPNVDSLANRLRMVQLECADVADDVRQQALTSELREAIKAVVPDQRKQFLAQLQSRFPSWAGRVDAVAATQSSFDENLLNNPDYLVGRLKELAAGLPTPRKEAIARELGEVGLSMTGKMSWPQEQMLEFRRVLGMEASESVDPCRLLEVCILLMNFACDADRVAWGTWRELAGPTSPIKRPAEAKVVLRKAVAGDANTPRTVVGPVITRLSRLFASLINAIPGVPRDAAEHARKVSPESVEKIRAREGGGGMFSAKEKACWEIYTRLFAANLGEEQIMAVVKKTIGDRVRRDMENSGT